MSLLTLACRQCVHRTNSVSVLSRPLPAHLVDSNPTRFLTWTLSPRYLSQRHLHAVCNTELREKRDLLRCFSSLSSSSAFSNEIKDTKKIKGAEEIRDTEDIKNTKDTENIASPVSIESSTESTSISNNSSVSESSDQPISSSSLDSSSSSPLDLSSPHDPSPSSPHDPSLPLTRAARLKRAVAEYGVVVPIFHISLALTSLGFFYVLVSAGVDFNVVFAFLGVEENKVSNLVDGCWHNVLHG